MRLNAASAVGEDQSSLTRGVGARIDSPHAGEASHMFFEDGLHKPAFSWLATHPPLAERIRAIDPGWDGRFDAAVNAPGLDRTPAV